MKERAFMNPYFELGPRSLAKFAAIAALTVGAITVLQGTLNDLFEVVVDTEITTGKINNEVTKIANTNDELYDMLALRNWGTSASNATSRDVTAIKNDIVSLSMDVLDIKTNTRQMLEQVKDIATRVKRVEELLAIVETNVASMMAIQSLMHTQNANLFTMLTEKLSRIIVLLEETTSLPNLRRRMNEAVNGILFDEMTTLDFTGDGCVYDPLGFGPIECVGSELAVAEVQGVRFQFV